MCPSSQATLQRGRDALVALMKHLKNVDKQNTVIMIYAENRRSS
jgi:hypothetical protein